MGKIKHGVKLLATVSLKAERVSLCGLYIVKPPNNGHIGTDQYREVVLFQRQKCIATYYIGWCIRKCPLYRALLYSECPLSEVPLNSMPVDVLIFY